MVDNSQNIENKNSEVDGFVVALAGNPNTGKSTVFNNLTGLKQHTGNWPGKTVGNADGDFRFKDENFVVVDLPGLYSINPISLDEKAAVDYIKFGRADTVVVVLDATCLERNLILALQIINICPNCIMCVNLLDEARRKGIDIDLKKLGDMLKTKVVGTSARNNIGMEDLKNAIYNEAKSCKEVVSIAAVKNVEVGFEDILKRVSEICEAVITRSKSSYDIDRKIDNIVLSRKFGIPIMLCVLAVIFWLTIFGANYPSGMLSSAFTSVEQGLNSLAISINMPAMLRGMLIEGMFRTLGWVISVMLPPMAIFFPLFTLLEDLGYLPRMAFNLDRVFKKARAHGKMVLTMCMGFGCNAAGVISARIIDSPRERLVAILTNNFVPCNGRFPTLIMLATIFIAGVGNGFASIKVTGVVLLAIIMATAITLIVSRILSVTILKGEASSFILELPPYRKPQIGKTIVRSMMDRTLFVLGRAVVVAAPAGIAIWVLQNYYIDGQSVLTYIAEFFNPLGMALGMDGYILTAFILGLPANEIVVPLIIMFYTRNSGLIEYDSLNELGMLLSQNGWTFKTAICTMLFSLNHFPCSTTLLTIKKETKSIKWTALAFVIPTVVGMALCFAVNLLI